MIQISKIHLRKSYEFLFTIIYFFSLSAIRSVGLRNYRDLMFDDETGNIYSALTSPWYELNPEGGALYIIWYKFILILFPNPIDTFYYSWTALHALTCLGFYWILRKFNVTFTWSLIFASVAAQLSLLEIGPFASLFASLFVISSFSIAGLFKNRILRLFTLASIVLVSGYIRPELMIASIFCLVLAIFYSIRQKNWSSFVAGLSIYASVWLVGFLTLGSSIQPFQKVDSLEAGRGTVAFGTLYAFSYAERHGLKNLDPWKEWERIVAENFPGDPKNMTEIFFANPPEFIRHMVYNASQLYRFARLYVPEWPIGKQWQGILGATLLAIFFLIVAIYLFQKIKKKEATHYFLGTNDNFFEFLLVTTCIVLNNLAAILIIYPRYHYLVVSCSLLFIFGTKILSDFFSERFSENVANKIAWMFVAAVFVLSPSRVSMKPWWTAFINPPTQKLEGLSMVQTIKQNTSYLEGVKKIRILEADFSRLIYLKKDFYPFTGINGDCLSIQSCLQKNHFDLIAMDSRLKLQYLSYDPQGYEDLQSYPEKYGYKKFSTGFEGSSLLIRSDLVP